jgi:hypothetical protein
VAALSFDTLEAENRPSMKRKLYVTPKRHA